MKILELFLLAAMTLKAQAALLPLEPNRTVVLRGADAIEEPRAACTCKTAGYRCCEPGICVSKCKQLSPFTSQRGMINEEIRAWRSLSVMKYESTEAVSILDR